MVFVTARDAALVAGTLVAALASTYVSEYITRWRGQVYRQQNKLEVEQDQTEDMDHCDDNVPRRIRKAETVLQRRTARIILVLESSCDMFNQMAVLRTAECFGIQHVWIVEPAFYKEHKAGRAIAREATDWLSIRRFKTSAACIQALRETGYEIWTTELSQDAVSLEDPAVKLPERVAIVMGREADGVSKDMIAAADKRVYLPIHGFADSLNLNVATGLVIQRLFFICPEARGAMTKTERATLRDTWYRRMVKGDEKAETFLANPPPAYADLRRPDDHRGAWMGSKVKRKIQQREAQLNNEAPVASPSSP
ncbi:Aste57867_21081 [Aphanomyces stellatus]|uniref:Aste57867_21081 protein n=1 Tax=Aphanomyces stellatus TaxID=120398 RepID=A0A485LGL6_9STRA|nr:hypothetical protein As57867_021013 [Aphanomyces stellatus]VFT97755.1 Aste57867_21081 [Aphanomyces stellatus]